MEESEAYRHLLEQFGWTQDHLAQRIGRDRTSIANSLRLLRLPDEIQVDLRSGRLTMGHARALLALPSTADQLKLRDEILAHDWSVRTTEDSIRFSEKTSATRRTPRRRRGHSPELASLEQSLQRALQTRVAIVGDGRRGKIEVTYANAEELERLAELLSQRQG